MARTAHFRRTLLFILVTPQCWCIGEKHDSSREMLNIMATDENTGMGMLSDENVALLFLRYRREIFSSSELQNTGLDLTTQFHAFSENARRLAKFIASQATGWRGSWEWEQAIDRGVTVGLTEHSHISPAQWAHMMSSGRRRIDVVFDERHARSTMLLASPIDLRADGLVPAHVRLRTPGHHHRRLPPGWNNQPAPVR
jgi:hypothetical protein